MSVLTDLRERARKLDQETAALTKDLEDFAKGNGTKEAWSAAQSSKSAQYDTWGTWSWLNLLIQNTPPKMKTQWRVSYGENHSKGFWYDNPIEISDVTQQMVVWPDGSMCAVTDDVEIETREVPIDTKELQWFD